MAKSRLEPNKIVRYAESNIPKNGIGTRPAPTVKLSPATAQAAVVDAIVSPAPPDSAPTPPSPPPVGVAETRSFLFDGATELTGSAVALNSLSGATIKMTVRPAWDSNITGSWTLFTLGTPNSNTYREEYRIETNIDYGPSFNTNIPLQSSASLTTADSASVNNDVGVDAADYTELTFNFNLSYNENALHLFRVLNNFTPFEDLTIPSYTRKDGNSLIFVVETAKLAGITDFKHRVRIANYQKLKSQLTKTIIGGGLGSYRYTKPLSNESVGSGDVLYLEFSNSKNAIKNVNIDGESLNGGGYQYNYPLPTIRKITANDSIAIGGLMSGSEEYFSGSIDQFALFDEPTGLSNKKYALDFSNDSNLKVYYQFEGTTAASVGNDLQVVGTETYVSSSL